MKIWIDDIKGYLQGYSMMEQPEAVEVEVDEDFSDFFNYRWNGTSLIYDPDNVPEPEPTPPTDVEVLQAENEELKQLVSKLMISNDTLKQTSDAMAEINAKTMLAMNKITNKLTEIENKLEGAG